MDRPLLESDSFDSVAVLKYQILLSFIEMEGDVGIGLIVAEGLPICATKSDSPPVLFRLKVVRWYAVIGMIYVLMLSKFL